MASEEARPQDGTDFPHEPRSAPRDRFATAAETGALPVWRPVPLVALNEATRNMRSRWIIPPIDGGSDYSVSEWELISAGWSDHHAHDELNYVLRGELHIECEGRTVVLGPGEAALVPKGRTGRYWAPEYARMIAVYGSNTEGEISEYLDYWEFGDGA